MDQNSRTAQFVPAQQGTYALSLWNDNTASIDKVQMFKCVQYYNPTLKRWQDECIPIVNPRYGYDMPILSTDRKKKAYFSSAVTINACMCSIDSSSTSAL